MSKQINVALIGNPNTGKTSVFNALTGLNQQVGNYPGITVEKKEGICKLPRGVKAHIIDLPGTYSLNASSLDESVVIELLLNKNDKDFPDVAVVVSDVENLKRNLLLFTQIKDLEIPCLLVVNMADRMRRKGITLDIGYLEQQLETKIAVISTRKNEGIENLKQQISNYKELSVKPCLNASEIDTEYFNRLQKAFPNQLLYKLWLVITQDVNFGKTDRKDIDAIASFKTKSKGDLKRLQQKETIKRYQFINNVLKRGQTIDITQATDVRTKLDRILTHKIWGYVIFFFILLTIFQAIYDWSSVPMDWIDSSFASLSNWVKETFPGGGKVTDLIAEGIISGLGGIVIFIPQIAFLFLFISILEESGYMSRVVFLMDRIMRRFGLSGKSIVPLISGTACAIPAIMATRNIESWKERLITILVTPFTTCSARLPVYLIIISLVIPEGRILGLSYQALTLMLLYLIGFGAAVGSAWILNKVLKIKSKTFFVVEMPNYKVPLFKNVALTVLEKTKAFIFGAGKIILAISIVLWVLASYGPGEQFNNAENIITEQYAAQDLTEDELQQKIASHKLEHSFIGLTGRAIEPAIRPLGYDWKIGIAIVSSFAAREVFVGTLATIYSVGSDDEETIKNRMAGEVNPILGGPLFNFASGISLLLFYAFAMQCMSTLAIVKKETNSWKWPTYQFVIMTAIAYIVALLSFQFLK
ncbi:ferrous iron transport protein B [Lacinutrix venerupis]|uniref:Ferrous iron transport protein B n=1 Tax=Lacinutrix venerupis TaxID=1486034 RepID=A0AAC9PVI8_9FLAO|nr:ferrous iron transport protein B [Lacinutrix venerupis]APX98854.1 ferrous iron transport protein B [Lacinutrix venerupis]RLJ63239.1 ferrous iron transport protein B [Lacinutrix venerupis]